MDGVGVIVVAAVVGNNRRWRTETYPTIRDFNRAHALR
jgi:hypothetical protein